MLNSLLVKKKTLARRPTRFRLLMASDPLETRTLCSAAQVSGPRPASMAITRDLGDVTLAAAEGSAKATALINPGGSVTFQFSLDRDGTYILFFRYHGEGVTLNFQTPGGEAVIHPGAADVEHVFALKLAAGNYAITALPSGSAPVYIDWDLILANGLGQAAAQNTQFLANEGPAIPIQTVSSAAPIPSLASTNMPVTGPSLVGGLPVGMPVNEYATCDVVGPTVGGGTVVTADITPGLSPSLVARSLPDPQFTNDGSIKAIDDDAQADRAVLASLDSSSSLTSVVMNLFSSGISSQSAPAQEDQPSEEGSVADARPDPAGVDGRATGDEEQRLNPARLAILAPAAFMAYQLHSRYRRSRRAGSSSPCVAEVESILGPPEEGVKNLPRWMREFQKSFKRTD